MTMFLESERSCSSSPVTILPIAVSPLFVPVPEGVGKVVKQPFTNNQQKAFITLPQNLAIQASEAFGLSPIPQCVEWRRQKVAEGDRRPSGCGAAGFGPTAKCSVHGRADPCPGPWAIQSQPQWLCTTLRTSGSEMGDWIMPQVWGRGGEAAGSDGSVDQGGPPYPTPKSCHWYPFSHWNAEGANM